jgi:hypothetical protein
MARFVKRWAAFTSAAIALICCLSEPGLPAELRAEVALPSAVCGPVDLCHGRQEWIMSAWRARLASDQPFALVVSISSFAK